MDQQISMKKFFNCFNSSHFRTKSKDKELSECSEYSSVSKINDFELKTDVTKKSHFHKLTSKTAAIFTKFSSQNHKPQSDTKPLETKTFFSCLKRKSSTSNKSPAIPGAKQVLDPYVQSTFKKEISLEIKRSSSNDFQSQEIETLMHDSVIELMSKDGTLKLYSATTLTPLSSIQDEERIQTHLSVSFLQHDKQIQDYYYSDGPDEVFEEKDETSKRLASNFQDLKMEHSNSRSENRSSGIPRNKKSHVTRDNKSEYLDKDLMSSDESATLFSDGIQERIQTSTKESKNKEKLAPVLNHCPCRENQNFISSHYDYKRNNFNHPQPLTSEETYQIVSNVPLPSTVSQKQDHCARSVHSCTSVTNPIPTVKKWILQLYFNSMVAADGNLCGYGNINNYPGEIQSEGTSPPFPYPLPKNLRTFNQERLERKNSIEAGARNSSKLNLNAVSYKYQSNIPPMQSRKNSSTIESENKYFEMNRLEIESKKYKSQSHSKSKRPDGDYHIQKENKLNLSRIKSVSTTESRMRRPFREKHQNSKPAIFSQVTTYTYYPFVDGPLANKSGWK